MRFGSSWRWPNNFGDVVGTDVVGEVDCESVGLECADVVKGDAGSEVMGLEVGARESGRLGAELGGRARVERFVRGRVVRDGATGGWAVGAHGPTHSPPRSLPWPASPSHQLHPRGSSRHDCRLVTPAQHDASVPTFWLLTKLPRLSAIAKSTARGEHGAIPDASAGASTESFLGVCTCLLDLQSVTAVTQIYGPPFPPRGVWKNRTREGKR